jgi:hypothetical protein
VPTQLSLRSRLLAVLGTVVLSPALLAIGAQPASASTPHHHLVHPRGASFEIAFPAKPQVDRNTDRMYADFTGAEAASGYYVSSARDDVLTRATLNPPASTYIVLTALYPTPAQAQTAEQESASTYELHAATINGLAGYETVGNIAPARAGQASSKVESIVYIRQGANTYMAFAFTRNATTALAFTHSLQITAGASRDAAEPGSEVDPGPPPAQLAAPKSATHRDGKIAAAVAIAVLVIGGVVWFVRRRSHQDVSPPLGYDPPTPGPPNANSNFVWMYTAPPPPGSLDDPVEPTG